MLHTGSCRPIMASLVPSWNHCSWWAENWAYPITVGTPLPHHYLNQLIRRKNCHSTYVSSTILNNDLERGRTGQTLHITLLWLQKVTSFLCTDKQFSGFIYANYLRSLHTSKYIHITVRNMGQTDRVKTTVEQKEELPRKPYSMYSNNWIVRWRIQFF